MLRTSMFSQNHTTVFCMNTWIPSAWNIYVQPKSPHSVLHEHADSECLEHLYSAKSTHNFMNNRWDRYICFNPNSPIVFCMNKWIPSAWNIYVQPKSPHSVLHEHLDSQCLEHLCSCSSRCLDCEHALVLLSHLSIHSPKEMLTDICPRNLAPSNVVDYYMKRVKTSWTYSI